MLIALKNEFKRFLFVSPIKTSNFRPALTYYKLSIMLLLNTPKLLVAIQLLLRTKKLLMIKNTVDEVLKNYLKQN